PPGSAISHSGAGGSRRAEGNRTGTTAGAVPADSNIASNLRGSESGSRDTALAWPEWPLSRKTCLHYPEQAVPDRAHRGDRLDENVKGDCRRAWRAGRSDFPAKLRQLR